MFKKIHYQKLGAKKRAIVDRWTEACNDRDAALRQLNQLRWYEVLFIPSRISKIVNALDCANERWKIMFDLMQVHGII